MSSRPRPNAPRPRPAIRRRFVRPNYSPARPTAAPRRIFARRLDRPAFKDRRARARDIFLRLGIGLGVFAVLGTAFIIFEGYYANRVNPHVSIDGIPLGGVSLNDVPQYIQQKIDERNSLPFILHADNRVYEVTSSQFHARYDLAPAIAAAQNDGHTGDFFTRVWNQFNTLLSGHDYALSGTHDSLAVQRFLSKVATDIAFDPQPAQVGVQDNDVTVTRESILGRRLDLAAAIRVLNTEINRHSVFDINLPVQFPSSPISHDVAQVAVDQAHALLNQNVFFSSSVKVRAWYLKPSQLLHLLTFTPGYVPGKGWSVVMGMDTRKLAVTMAPIAAAVNHEAVPAYFKVVDAANGQPDTAVPYPESPGLAIDIDKAALAILASPSNDHNAVIPFTHPPASFTLADARALNFDMLQGKGISGVLGSSTERYINAHATAGMLNNIRLEPGQFISVTSVITPVVQANGFVPEVGGFGLRYDIAGTNGGPSATTSALFQAAYRAGLTIVQRESYPNVTEYNGPPGTDAMVQARPHGADLQIINNTKHVILVMIRVGHTSATAYIFNNSSVHRTVTVFGPLVTLNQDGSIDAQIGRVTSGDKVLQDQYRTHYNAVDQYQ